MRKRDVSVRRCDACGARQTLRAKFCSECGTALHMERASGGQATPANGDVRPLTVLFCDLADSTAMAARLDLELWQEVLHDYQRAVESAVGRFGGHVARIVGDGILIYFGWPTIHEDDGERAIRSAFAILAELERLNRSGPHSGRLELHVRLAAHSGMTLVGKSGEAFGETPHLAARAHAMAGLDTVIVTEALRTGIAQAFDAEDLGLHDFKGISRPVRLFAVVRPTAVMSARGAQKSDPTRRVRASLVGRDQELDIVSARWAAAQAGRGHTVLLIGEPGIGKSRLIEEFHHTIAERPHRWIEARTSAYFRSTAFHPIANALRDAIGVRDLDATPDDVGRLERILTNAGVVGIDNVHLVAELLGLPFDASSPTVHLSREQRRLRLITTLADWVVGSRSSSSTVFVLEDVHWSDPSTLELLAHVQRRAEGAPLLVLLSSRPEGIPSLGGAANETQIVLRPLDKENIVRLLEITAPAVPAAVRPAIIRRSEGVPLFIEEFARPFSQGRSPAVDEIPSTLSASVTGRLARLGTARQVAQLCAVIGFPLNFQLICRASPLPEAELAYELQRLIDAEILVQDRSGSDVSYRFVHALFQEVAYDSLLSSHRRGLHRRVANVLQRHFPAISERRPETMARHWTGARETQLAISAWVAAGHLAVHRRAFAEARDFYRAALQTLMSLPESAERDDRELEIRYALFAALQITEGYAADELAANTSRARALTERSGDTVKLISLATGSWAALSSAGDYAAAARVANEIGDLAARDGGSENLAHAHMVQLTARSRVGDLLGAERSFLDGERHFSVRGFRQKAGAIAQTYGNSAKVAALLGRTDQALARAGRALAVAAENGNPYDLAFANHMASTTFLTLRLPERARSCAERSVALSDEHRFPQFAAIARVALGRAVAELENPGAGVTLMRQGLEAMERNGGRAALTMYLVWLAEAQELAQCPGNAVETIEQALVANPEEQLYRAEALRLRGWYAVQAGNFDRGEEDVRLALKLATTGGALRFRLRSAVSLARIAADRGRSHDAAADLAAVLADTSLDPTDPDVADACQLLQRLPSPSEMRPATALPVAI